MYFTTSPTLWSFSASSSGISWPKASSRAMTNSTVSRESAPKSSMNLASGVTWSALTPSCSTMISLTLASTDFSEAMTVLHFCFLPLLCHEPAGVKPRFARSRVHFLAADIWSVVQAPLCLSAGVNSVQSEFARTSHPSHHHAAIDGQNLARDITTPGPSQEQHRFRDVLRLAQCLQRNAFQQCG